MEPRSSKAETAKALGLIKPSLRVGKSDEGRLESKSRLFKSSEIASTG
jgi:hypothetical protein